MSDLEDLYEQVTMGSYSPSIIVSSPEAMPEIYKLALERNTYEIFDGWVYLAYKGDGGVVLFPQHEVEEL